MTELATFAGEKAPWLVPAIVILWFLLLAGERLTGKDGIATRTLTWVRNRDLRDLEHQAEVIAARERIEQMTESRKVARYRRELEAVYAELQDDEATIEWLVGERNDQRRRDRAQAEAQAQFNGELVDWLGLVIERAASAVPPLTLPPPPRPPEGLASLIVLDEDLPADAPPLRPRTGQERIADLRRHWAEQDDDDDDAALQAALRNGSEGDDELGSRLSRRGG